MKDKRQYEGNRSLNPLEQDLSEIKANFPLSRR
jgi:hypothetical protein